MSHITQHSVAHVLTQDKRDECMSMSGALIDSADKDGMFLNWIITGDETWCFLYDLQLKRQSAITKREEATTGQVKRQGTALTGFRPICSCSHGIHPRGRNCKQTLLQGDPLLSTKFTLS
jgi:hypothetical protein